MTAIATHLTIADLVLRSLNTTGVATPSDANLNYYRLGAIYPLLGDYLPSRTEAGVAAPNSPVFDVWKPILKLLAGSPAAPGLYPTLKSLRSLAAHFKEAIDARDTLALAGLRDEVSASSDLITALQDQLATATGLKDELLKTIARAKPATKTDPISEWRARDILHGSQTGAFLRELRSRAAASGDPRLEAFALGACVGYSSALTGNAFINGVVGGPLRNHWWRHRWIAQHIDSWVWGYYKTRDRIRADKREITFTNPRVPNPPLSSWDNICGAELQKLITIGAINEDAIFAAIAGGTPMPSALPIELTQLWLDSSRSVYGDLTAAGFDDTGLQSAYAMMWLTAWISTSSGFLTSIPPDQVPVPTTCGAQPEWVQPDGSVILDGAVTKPPKMGKPSPNWIKTASAIAAALLAIANFAVSNIAAGLELLYAAVKSLEDGVEPVWEQIDCRLAWTTTFVLNLENNLRDVLVNAGLAAPHIVRLKHEDIHYQLGGSDPPSPTDAALASCRSRNSEELPGQYPQGVWNAQISDWTRYPTTGLEQPDQISYSEQLAWPNDFVDGWKFVDNGANTVPRFSATQENPLASTPFADRDVVISRDEWDMYMKSVEIGHQGRGARFGNAVDVALSLIKAKPEQMLNWDLDSDRGSGWPTWVWRDPVGLPGQVVRE